MGGCLSRDPALPRQSESPGVPVHGGIPRAGVQPHDGAQIRVVSGDASVVCMCG